MTKRTKALRLIAALEKQGWAVDTSAISRKYVVLIRHNTDSRYYVGKAGALRHGKTIAASVPCDVLKANLLRQEK